MSNLFFKNRDRPCGVQLFFKLDLDLYIALQNVSTDTRDFSLNLATCLWIQYGICRWSQKLTLNTGAQVSYK